MFKSYLIKKLYVIKPNFETMANTQANSILEWIHQVVENPVRTFDSQNSYLDKYCPWSGILSANYFVVQSKQHITLNKTPIQLVCRRDIIFNTPFITD